MKELAKTYDPSSIEDRTYAKWMGRKYFHTEVDRSKKPFTIVMPPPNITGKLHMTCTGQYSSGYSDPLQENAGLCSTVGSGN